MKLPFPRTLASQLVAILICVLIISQIVTMIAVIGERRFTARMTETGAAMSRFVDEAKTLQLEPNTELPYLIYEGGTDLSVLQVSRVSQVERMRDAKPDQAAADQLRHQLEDAGLHPISVQVARRQLDRASRPPRPVREASDLASGTSASVVLTPPPPPSTNPLRDSPPPPSPRRDRPRDHPYRRPPPQEDIYRRDPPQYQVVPERSPETEAPQITEPEPQALDSENADDGAQSRADRQPRDVIRPIRPPDRNGPPPPGLEEVIMSAQLEPGVWLNAQKTYYSAIAVSYRIALFTGGIALLSSLVVWLFARRIARPLRHLAVSADKLGRGRTSEKVVEQGPQDVRMAAQAFNQMQDRLTRLLETQRTMLRAVGHDLRTPLTSLRIRAESIPPEHGQEQIIATLNDMQVMTEEILRWARDSSGLEDVSAVDIGTLLQSMTDDYADRGEPVCFRLPERAIIAEVRRVALRRAVQNLIDNALKYGSKAEVSVRTNAHHVIIQVDDEGPGIPTDRLPEITKPFVRLEGSRSKHTGGLGLGLAIVQSVVLAHGGDLSFANRATGGLSARISLPKTS